MDGAEGRIGFLNIEAKIQMTQVKIVENQAQTQKNYQKMEEEIVGSETKHEVNQKGKSTLKKIRKMSEMEKSLTPKADKNAEKSEMHQKKCFKSSGQEMNKHEIDVKKIKSPSKRNSIEIRIKFSIFNSQKKMQICFQKRDSQQKGKFPELGRLL